MELDLQYIDKWSLLLDFKILLKTIPAVLKGSGSCLIMSSFLNRVNAPSLPRPLGAFVPSFGWWGWRWSRVRSVWRLFMELSSDQSISILVVGAIFFALMWFAVSTAPSTELRSRNLVFALWWVLLGSEEVFSYMTDDAEGGQFSSGAYSEAMIWVFVGLIFLLYTYRNSQYLRTLFTGSYKWVSWFGVMCLLSCAYAEKPSFSLAWIIKLFLAILLLAACNSEIKSTRRSSSFPESQPVGSRVYGFPAPGKVAFES